jgi:arginine decarboxylase
VPRLIFSGVQPRWIPGIPAVVLGKRLTDCVVEHVRTGDAEGVNVPDAADTSLSTFRVVAQ